MCFMIIEDIMFCIRFGGMVGMLLLVEGVVDIGMKGVTWGNKYVIDICLEEFIFVLLVRICVINLFFEIEKIYYV